GLLRLPLLLRLGSSLADAEELAGRHGTASSVPSGVLCPVVTRHKRIPAHVACCHPSIEDARNRPRERGLQCLRLRLGWQPYCPTPSANPLADFPDFPRCTGNSF